MPAPSKDEKEDNITNSLCETLRQNRTARSLPFQINTQHVELDPMPDEELGRLDIVFVPLVPREDIYFCLECKRLNVIKSGQKRSYASEYVLYGMMSFITGQYSKAVHHGCHAALNSRTGDPYFSALSAFSLQSHCTEITDVCSQIADDVRDEVCPRFECKSGTNGRWRARPAGA